VKHGARSESVESFTRDQHEPICIRISVQFAGVVKLFEWRHLSGCRFRSLRNTRHRGFLTRHREVFPNSIGAHARRSVPEGIGLLLYAVRRVAETVLSKACNFARVAL
jgi:hypothetical protein